MQRLQFSLELVSIRPIRVSGQIFGLVQLDDRLDSALDFSAPSFGVVLLLVRPLDQPTLTVSFSNWNVARQATNNASLLERRVERWDERVLCRTASQSIRALP